MDLDLLVIGSGPSGQKAAIQAAKLGKRVAVVERRQRLGGVSIHTGTIPSKTLRVAVLDELARRPLDVPDPLQPREPRAPGDRVPDGPHRARRRRGGAGRARAVPPQPRRPAVRRRLVRGRAHRLHHRRRRQARPSPRRTSSSPSARHPARPPDVAFDDETIIDSDGLLHLHQRLPRSMTVVGAGVIGVEYASMFGRLGTKVTVVDQRPRVLTFLDGEIGEALQYILRRNNVTFRLNEKVAAVTIEQRRARSPRSPRARRSAPRPCSTPPGRQGATDSLELERRASRPTSAGASPVDEDFRTKVPHIFAVGDVRRRVGPRGDGDGAGPPGGAARVRAPGHVDARAAADRRLRDPRDRDGGPHGGGPDRGRRPLRGRASRAGRSSRAG